ncbi:protein of unknown function [Blastococcus saxobsidens DD2]|uniref:Uncharacterized protein n=1 Tax=Blastococcus saxobsidens (strain DD2) TaxID=1146883 RepID=H6RSE8_BLASD|nr:protein of unknown function [Blastococcus saxobsidens DD2]
MGPAQHAGRPRARRSGRREGSARRPHRPVADLVLHREDGDRGAWAATGSADPGPEPVAPTTAWMEPDGVGRAPAREGEPVTELARARMSGAPSATRPTSAGEEVSWPS